MVKGKLYRSENGRWRIVPYPYCHEETSYSPKDIELGPGDMIEVAIDGFWIPTRIEFNGIAYFPAINGIRLYDGMACRLVRKK